MFEVGYRIGRLRQNKGWTQEELASRSGIRQANLSRIESSTQDVTLTTFLRICSSLGVPPENFFVDQEEKAFLWTRTKLERVSKAVVGSTHKLKGKEKEIADLLRNVIPGFNRRLSTKRVYQSWLELREKLSDQEIRSLVERVRDAQQRSL